MTVKHHISDDLIFAYGAGTLDEATGILVATHMALCPQCRDGLLAAESLGGALLENAGEAEVGDDALASLFDRIDGMPEQPAPAAAPSRPASAVLPRPLRDYVGGDVEQIRWRSLGGGVRHCPLETGSAGSTARLLFIPAGADVPDHGHRGLELTLVLTGAFYDRGVWFRRGDVEEADATIDHKPVAGPEEPCICLAVTDAPLRFHGLLPRLVQRFVGI